MLSHVYFLQVERVEDPVLRSSLITLLRLVEVIKDLVSKAGVYEEEDFQPYQAEEVGDQQKKKKKRFKAFRRFSSMGKGRSAQGKRDRFMSSAT